MSLKVLNVSKNFGTKKAVDNISFEINSPGVFGLLGTNGAGKTTTIRMMLGILTKGHGEITWNGKIVTRKNVNFGYLPEERGIYPKSKVYDQLMYFAKLKGMKKEKADENIKKWAKKLEIEEYLYLPAEKLSKGNQQKVQFVTAIMHDPELIILDEPFSGLDPINSQIVKDVITELVAAGKYIVLCSHQMMQIEEFCKDIVIINKGVTVLKGNLKDIKETYESNRLFLSTDVDIKEEIESLGLKIKFEKNNEYEIEIKGDELANKLLKNLASKDIKIIKFEIKKPTLHEIFIEKAGV